MNQHVYREIITNHLEPSAQQLFPDGNYLFQQDNDPKHKARTVMTYLKEKNIPQLVDWPPQSPDLNPIENLWSILDRNLQDRNPNNEGELFQQLMEGWQQLGYSIS